MRKRGLKKVWERIKCVKCRHIYQKAMKTRAQIQKKRGIEFKGFIYLGSNVSNVIRGPLGNRNV